MQRGFYVGNPGHAGWGRSAGRWCVPSQGNDTTSIPGDVTLGRDTGLDQMVGCCPKAFLNFFGLLGFIDGLNSEFLFWLKGELQEDEPSLTSPCREIRQRHSTPFFKTIFLKSSSI